MEEDFDTSAAVSNYLKSRSPQDVARTSYSLAATSNPDAEAEYKRLAKQAGIPIDSVRENKDDVKRQLDTPDFNDLAAKFPSTTAYLSNLQNSRVAHDDVGGLSGVEKAIRGLLKPGGQRIERPISSVMNSREFSAEVRRQMELNPGLDADTARKLVMNGSVVDNQATRMGPLRGPEPGADSVVSGLIGAAKRMPVTFDAQLGYIATDILGLDQAQNRKRLDALETQNLSSTPAFETATGKGLYNGGVSTIQNLPGMATAIGVTMAGNPALGMQIGLGIAGTQAAVPAYSKYRERGASGGMAAVAALGEGAVEVVTELIPMGSMLKVFGKNGKGASLQFLKSQFQEQWTEQIATIAQDAIDTAVANPNKTWAEYVAERPGAAYQTFLATLVQTGAITIAHKAAQKVTGAAYNNSEAARQAEDAATRAEDLVKAVQAAKLSTRDATGFQEFVKQVAEDGETPAELYIDAAQLTNTLNQAGITMERLEMIAPVVAAQMRAASFVPGADIRVPVAEFAAAGADITTPLIDHLRDKPDAMSRAEAREYLAAEGDTIQSDVETEIGKVGERVAAQQEIDAVSARFEAELNAAGRYRPADNKANASILGNLFTTMAARSGKPLEQFLQEYRLGVTGKAGRGAQTLEQVGNVTMAEIDALNDTLTVDIMSEAVAAVGDAEFKKRVDVKTAQATANGKFPTSESMLIEATAREIVALTRRGKTPTDQSIPVQPAIETEAQVNARNEALIDLRKRLSVLKSIRKCMGG